MKEIEKANWFQSLADDCQSIITEGIWASRFTLIETYHMLGKRIIKDYQKFEANKIKGESVVRVIAAHTNQNTRTIYYAIQFAKMFPCDTSDLPSELPEGKNLSWRKLINEVLPNKKEHECNFVPVTMYECSICKKKRKNLE